MEINLKDGFLTMRFQNSRFVGNGAVEGGGLKLVYSNNGLNPRYGIVEPPLNSYGIAEISNCTFLSNNARNEWWWNCYTIKPCEIGIYGL